MHRARSGFVQGPAPVIYNYFRGFRSLVESQHPDRVVFVLDGEPKKRLEVYPEYKANRVLKEDDPKIDALKIFHEQKDEIIKLLSSSFPVSVVYHPEYEADDVIYTIIKNSASCIDITVVSSDTDFTQLFDEFNNVSVYNPVQKKYLEKHSCDYVLWKSLKGDPCDNIVGFVGVGGVTAEKMVHDPCLLESFLSEDDSRVEKLELNLSLVKLQHIQDENDMLKFESSSPTKDWDYVKDKFVSYGFKSIIKDNYWEKFITTFDTLWIT